MGSEQRRRPHILTVRLYDEQNQFLVDTVAAHHPMNITRADVARMILFGESLHDRPQCSTGHPACTAAHQELVTGYRLERYRQEIEHEAVTGAYAGDGRIWTENGGKLITFKDWLDQHHNHEDRTS